MVPLMLAMRLCLFASEYRERHSQYFINACVYSKDRRGEEDGSFNLSDVRINKIRMCVRDFARKKGFAVGDINKFHPRHRRTECDF